MKSSESKTTPSHLPQTQKPSQPFFKKEGAWSVFSKEAQQMNFFVSPKNIQPKLTIGQPRDQYKQEADAMADKVVQQMSVGDQSAAGRSSGDSSPQIQMKCAACEHEERLQKKGGEGAFFIPKLVQLKPQEINEPQKEASSDTAISGGPSPLIQLSPLSDQVRASYANQEKGRVFDVLRANSPTQDADLRTYIQSIFAAQTDDLWLANSIMDHGPEPLWPGALLSERHQRSVQGGWAPEPGNIGGTLGVTAQGRPVNAFFFPGITDMRAMVIGGVHGSELSGVEVIDRLLTILQTGPRPHYSVIIVPRLFPDNIARREAGVAAGTIQHDSNTGRYTCDSNGNNCGVDPNRQFPEFGHAYDSATQQDSRGRTIEQENRMLLELIDRFRPARIVSVHAIHAPSLAGVFADPRTDFSGHGLGYDTDRALALAMAERAAAGGAGVQGNRLDASGHAQSSSTTQYRRDPAIAGVGQPQTRSRGSGDLPNNRGRGVSMGGWGSTAICDPANAAHNRAAMRIITVEVSTTRRSGDMPAAQQASRSTEIEAHADAIREIFLGQNQVEAANQDPCAVATPPTATQPVRPVSPP